MCALPLAEAATVKGEYRFKVEAKHLCYSLLYQTVYDRRNAKFSIFPLFRFRNGYSFHRRGTISTVLDSFRKFAGVSEDVGTEFIRPHPVDAGSPMIRFDPFQGEHHIGGVQYAF